MTYNNQFLSIFRKTLFLAVICCNIVSFGQKETHRWTPLVVNDDQKVWYDYNQIYNLTLPKFEIWLLEVHKTPVKVEGVVSGALRTKTLYAINLETMSYGIMSVAYYNINNQEIKRFDYGLDDYEEKYKYSYPILEKSLIGMLVKKISEKGTK